MGYIIIDPDQFPREPWLRDLIFELARRVDGRVDHFCPGGQYRVRAEGVTEEELARLWEEVRAEHRTSVRWGASERKKRETATSRRRRA